MASFLPAAVATTGAHPVTATIEARAAATVRKWVTDPDEQAEVLAMLGLLALDPNGVSAGYSALAAAIVTVEDTEGSP